MSGTIGSNLVAGRSSGLIASVAAAGLTLGTEAASTSGTTVDFTGIPAGTKRITIMFEGVSKNGVEEFLVQIGDAGGFETSGYDGSANMILTSAAQSEATDAGGFIMGVEEAEQTVFGHMVLTLKDADNFSWISSHVASFDSSESGFGGGGKDLSAELTQVRVTTDGSPNTWDAGSINILLG